MLHREVSGYMLMVVDGGGEWLYALYRLVLVICPSIGTVGRNGG